MTSNTTSNKLIKIIAGLCVISGSFSGSLVRGQSCGNFGITLGSTPTISQDIGNTFDQPGPTPAPAVIGDINHRIYSLDHNTVGAFPTSISSSSLCTSGDPFFLTSRQGSPHPAIYLSDPSPYIGAAITGNISPSQLGFPNYASVQLENPLVAGNFDSYLNLYYADSSSNQRSMGSWACILTTTTSVGGSTTTNADVEICSVYNYTSNPTCGIADGTVTDVSAYASYSHDDFCDNFSLLTYNNNYFSPVSNPNSDTSVTTLKNAIAAASTGTTISWSCTSQNANPSLTTSFLSTTTSQNCSVTLTGTSTGGGNTTTGGNSNGNNTTIGAYCGTYDKRSNFYPFGGFYSGELQQIILSNGSTLNNFCGLGDTYIQGSYFISGSLHYWTCADTLANPVNPPTSQCFADVRPSPNAICEIVPNPYNNSVTPLTDGTQIDNSYCMVDPAHPGAATSTPALQAVNVVGGNTQPWQWTCQGGYYNDTLCTATSYGICGSADGSSIWNFNTSDPTLCDNGIAVDVTTGVSQNSQYPFVWSWKCRGSTTDGSTDDLCTANAEGATCGTATATGSAYLTATSPNLCDNGQPANFGIQTSTNPFYDYEWVWDCQGPSATVSTQCRVEATKASCGIAHQATHATLTSNDPNLCVQGVASNFQAINSSSPQYNTEWTWTCPGGVQNGLLDSDCIAYEPSAPVNGLCNPITNNQTFYYNDVTNYLQCTQGTPSTPLVANPANNVWTYTCINVFSGTNDSCTINQIEDGDCTSYSVAVGAKPTLLCDGGTPSVVTNNNGYWLWDCQGINGGNNAMCSAQCLNGDCDDGGQQTCVINGTGSNACTDGVQPSLDVGETCNDFDGCICGQQTVLNGQICTAQVLTFPGKLADLRIQTHMAESGSVVRGERVSFELIYKNNGPDTATGAVVEYVYSELLEDFESDMLFTLSGTVSSGATTGAAPIITYNKMLFAVGDIASGETGKVVVSGKIRTVFGSSDLTNNAQITSLVDDPNPLNNNLSASTLIIDELTKFAGYVINPLLSMKSLIDRYVMIIQWINTDYVYRDILPGHEWYMHIMTVTRMGIMNGYNYKHARLFSPKKCTSYVEGVIVAAKVMHMRGDQDVYTRMYEDTPFADANFNPHISNFINRGYRRGIIADSHIEIKDGKQYMHPHKPITHKEMKEIMFRLYRLANEDTNVLKPLLAKGSQCVTREELAYTVAHALRGNSQVVMGFNDHFLSALYNKLQPISIKERRYVINRIIFKLNEIAANRMYKIGLDPETLIGILQAAMRGEMYNYNYDTSSADNFFYQVSDDKYDEYIQDLFEMNY